MLCLALDLKIPHKIRKLMLQVAFMIKIALQVANIAINALLRRLENGNGKVGPAGCQILSVYGKHCGSTVEHSL